MKVVLTLALLACVAALTKACCTPDQWEGIQSSTGGYHKGLFKNGVIKEFTKVAYDATNKRAAATILYINNKLKKNLKIITAFDSNATDVDNVEEGCGGGKMYYIDLDKNRCYARHICKFRKLCVPAKAEGKDYYLGLEGVFKVKGFQFKKSWKVKWYKNFITTDLSVYDAGKDVCAPVGEQHVGHMYGLTFIQTTGFVNITPGIKDPKVFDVPKICEKAEDASVMDEFPERDHFVMAL